MTTATKTPTEAVTQALPFLRSFGFNLVPLGGDKRPVIVGTYTGKNGKPQPKRYQWEGWAKKPQSDTYWAKLPNLEWWGGVQGLAAICGPVSGGLVCLDFDGLADASHIADVLEGLGLPADYEWAYPSPRVDGGWHVWLLCPDLETTMEAQNG
ncbi:MAG: bifunctional DNA primase/polymerase [Caldilineaceae bacterium]|nr:bifunctional DNA primase/polymerase [Caldilineaceae bacterium]HRJ44690.1 bifunctional DNA primase/polymerase [Caldilineaceae bacterium]